MILGINPYLVLDGSGQEAVQFYKEALDAKVEVMQTFGDMPENPEYPIPAEAKERVLHATLKIGNTDLMISDTFPGQGHAIGSQVTIAIQISNAEKAKYSISYKKVEKLSCHFKKHSGAQHTDK